MMYGSWFRTTQGAGMRAVWYRVYNLRWARNRTPCLKINNELSIPPAGKEDARKDTHS